MSTLSAEPHDGVLTPPATSYCAMQDGTLTPESNSPGSGRASGDITSHDSLVSPSDERSPPARKRRRAGSTTSLSSPAIPSLPPTHDISHVPFHISNMEKVDT